MNPKNWISATIRAYRESRGKTQLEVAEGIGVDTKTYGAWERENFDIKVKHLEKLAEYYKIPVSEFWDESKWISKPYKSETKSTAAEEPSFIYGKMANVPAECQKIVDKLESEIVILREQNLALTRAFNELFESKKTKTLTA